MRTLAIGKRVHHKIELVISFPLNVNSPSCIFCSRSPGGKGTDGDNSDPFDNLADLTPEQAMIKQGMTHGHHYALCILDLIS